jgi:Zn-dependent protease with chaperone function
MIAYLINASAIWLVSLLAFDLLLRRDTSYVRSRAYLLSTLAAGLVLPLIELPLRQAINTPALTVPMAQVQSLPQTLELAAQPLAVQYSLAYLWLAIYLGGVAFSLTSLAKEAIVLASWYRKGRKEKRDGYTIVFTDKVHSPFSILRLVFISSGTFYNHTELSFILSHEQQHVRRRHSLDKFFTLLLRSAFWFHPLVYVYYQRLMMVHEFEADAALAEHEAYGAFLIKQHLLGPSPAIAHPLNYSPLKTRILMLSTKRTKTWRKAAYAIAMPAVAALATLWANSTTAHKIAAPSSVALRKYTFEMGVPRTPTQLRSAKREWEEGGKADMRTSWIPGTESTIDSASYKSFGLVPTTMNGEPVYEAGFLSNRPAYHGVLGVLAKVVEGTGPLLEQLPDGKYHVQISKLVVDQGGRVAYYEISPLEWFSEPVVKDGRVIADAKRMKEQKAAHAVNADLSLKITEAMRANLERLQFEPGIRQGKAVNAYTNRLAGDWEVIRVANKKVDIVTRRGDGC